MPNALATWHRDWAIIPDMNIAKQVRRVKQSIEADCAPEIENNRMAPAKRISLADLSVDDLAAVIGDVIKISGAKF